MRPAPRFRQSRKRSTVLEHARARTRAHSLARTHSQLRTHAHARSWTHLHVLAPAHERERTDAHTKERISVLHIHMLLLTHTHMHAQAHAHTHEHSHRHTPPASMLKLTLPCPLRWPRTIRLFNQRLARLSITHASPVLQMRVPDPARDDQPVRARARGANLRA
eukprot:5442674-Pleurochrysis_carterae.AAC.2